MRGDLASSRAALERADNLARELQSRSLDREVICELGLLEEAESAHLAGAAQEAKHREARTLVQDGMHMLEEMHAKEAAKYRSALERLGA